ncbi:sugar phosphate nucleotidyltransferase [Arenibacter sp. GZD96]|uniref:nucleotidyltransferase family protein n=1 Tax=Aurantibrevibacter litoralis TaxID=3106030 RepID=UPI002AFECFA8|nr:sugar phosphate nucleotidyltransferase [Arenibacter sp. GZD-96]MEA1784799.1 sugar phosphate nucleotidyltransferase [Arenibacter sp. GZD-96]
MTLLLMAAGSGSRYGKLKQFDDLGPLGEFLMEFSIYDALENGFQHIVVVTKKENVDFLQNHLSDRLPKNIKLDVLAQELTDLPNGVAYTGERQKPWGTAHAVWTARKVIKTPFVVLNADDYYGKPAFKSAADFMQNTAHKDAFALVGYTLKDTLSEHGSVSRGVCTADHSNVLLSVKERTQLQWQEDKVVDLDSATEYTGNELVSMNYWICRPSLFEVIEDDLRTFFAKGENLDKGEIYIPFVIQEMVQSGKTTVHVLPSKGKWFGVTYASDRVMAVDSLAEMTQNGLYSSPLWN